MACNHPVGVQLPGHPPSFVAEAVVVKAPVRKAGQASSILARCTKLMAALSGRTYKTRRASVIVAIDQW
jgi:hypothetical protein